MRGRVVLASALLVLGTSSSNLRAAEPWETATVGRFVSCFEEEGVTFAPENLAVLQAAMEDLPLEEKLDVMKDPAVCPPAAPNAPACLAAIEGIECTALAGELMEEVAPEGLPSQADEWARAYSSAIVDRTVECYGEETKEDLDEAGTAKVESFSGILALSLTLLTRDGGCKLVEKVLPECTSWLRGRDCGALLADLVPMVEGRGADESPKPGAAKELPDVETASDAELDAMLGADSLDRTVLLHSLMGPCTELLECASGNLERDLDAEVKDAEQDNVDTYYEFHEKKKEK